MRLFRYYRKEILRLQQTIQRSIELLKFAGGRLEIVLVLRGQVRGIIKVHTLTSKA